MLRVGLKASSTCTRCVYGAKDASSLHPRTYYMKQTKLVNGAMPYHHLARSATLYSGLTGLASSFGFARLVFIMGEKLKKKNGETPNSMLELYVSKLLSQENVYLLVFHGGLYLFSLLFIHSIDFIIHGVLRELPCKGLWGTLCQLHPTLQV